MKILQRKLLESREAKLLAIRKITQDNRGKATAGVDNISIIKPNDRFKLVSKMILNSKASPIRRVFIPKSNGKLRPLGIPTIEDRCKQMLVKFVLEPEWEARFDKNSYGFRPGYTAWDAKKAVTNQMKVPKYFLDADIKGCFDNINHNSLLDKLKTIPMIKAQIKAWLKAGIVSNSKEWENIPINDAGTPQGGVISPLLCNIAFNGFEASIMDKFPRDSVKIIRYADDFMIMGLKLENILKAKLLAEKFLKTIGLELSLEKTRIGNTLIPHTNEKVIGKPGFDFLGFHYRNRKVSIHRGKKTPKGTRRIYICDTRPSLEAVQNHKSKVRNILRVYKSLPIEAMVKRLAASIRGWTSYMRMSNATKTFIMLDGWIFKRLWKWATKRYKSAKAAKKACFSVKGWDFGSISKKKRFTLKRYDKVKMKVYFKIQAGASVYNKKQLLYFAARMSDSNDRFKRLIKVLKKQNFSCATCKLVFTPKDEKIELHHVLKDGIRTEKLQFLHGHCHDQVHSQKVIEE